MFRKKASESKFMEAIFMGEGSEDAGGPFRDALESMASELMSPVLPLLIKSSNNRNDSGSFRECYILNPEPTTPATANMYQCLGRLFGFCFMSGQPLQLNLAPFVWK